jgi:hypothetical protein
MAQRSSPPKKARPLSGTVVYGEVDDASHHDAAAAPPPATAAAAMYATVGARTPGLNASNANAAAAAVENHDDMRTPGQRRSTGPTEPQYVARDAMVNEPAMYDVAPTDAVEVVRRPTMQGGANTVNQVKERRRSSISEADQCTRPSPTGGQCKNPKVGGRQFCKGHSCKHPGCDQSKSSSAGACPAHLNSSSQTTNATRSGTKGHRANNGGGGGGRGIMRKPSVYEGFGADAEGRGEGSAAVAVKPTIVQVYGTVGDGSDEDELDC